MTYKPLHGESIAFGRIEVRRWGVIHLAPFPTKFRHYVYFLHSQLSPSFRSILKHYNTTILFHLLFPHSPTVPIFSTITTSTHSHTLLLHYEVNSLTLQDKRAERKSKSTNSVPFASPLMRLL
jgi:hypothetical protein